MGKPQRKYLGKRKLTGQIKTAMTVEQTISDWTTLRIKTALGVTFRETSRVSLVRPWLMPPLLYRWLMRTIVVVRDSSLEPRRSTSASLSTTPSLTSATGPDASTSITTER